MLLFSETQAAPIATRQNLQLGKERIRFPQNLPYQKVQRTDKPHRVSPQRQVPKVPAGRAAAATQVYQRDEETFA